MSLCKRAANSYRELFTTFQSKYDEYQNSRSYNYYRDIVQLHVPEFSNHASKGWKYLNNRDYNKAKQEFEFSLANDIIPGDSTEAKKYLLLLIEKYPKHRLTKPQVDLWNYAYPNYTINF